MTRPLWPCYVINLADNTVRMDNVRAQLDAQGIAFERVEAVNGWALSDEEIAQVYDPVANAKRGKQDLVPAEMGCYLSHIHAWRTIAAGPADGGVILEDDFQAVESLSDVLGALCASPDRAWDIAKLFSINADPKIIASSPLTEGYVLATPLRVPSTTLGYAITRQAAQVLLERSVPFFRPIDEDHKFLWEHGLRVSLVIPSPVVVGEQEAVTGTIGAARRKRSKGRALRKLRYQLGYQLRIRLHRLGRRG